MRNREPAERHRVDTCILKLVQVKTTLAKPKVKKQRVAALAMNGDEYLALCDSYSQGVMPASR